VVDHDDVSLPDFRTLLTRLCGLNNSIPRAGPVQIYWPVVNSRAMAISESQAMAKKSSEALCGIFATLIKFCRDEGG
jgi:hypothetical protein